ncbi:hypothetical protein [Leptolyngbya sp. FACHB-16]|uniref:hypothetical protein n=1 Tax=unclassified Leptolyngbya TaxID=2650499 RepID=UPI0016849612|nr:hypothetical protein [Leptolyngbya sp. FACHB-16]MBD2156277.1 hypothetical protein [Leptolyngbya sp. FACHB-16]
MTSSTVNDTKIITTIPENVPAPKFELFQQVSLNKRRGTIVGMTYTSALEALAMRLDAYGWTYDVSFVYGLPPEQAIGADETEEDVAEDRIEALVITCA